MEIEGPGLIVRIDDSGQPVPPGAAAADYLVTASDLRDLVVELWLAGAEAISVNGERIVETTAFTDIGSSILVNSAYLQPPYDLSVIGPPELYDRLTTSPSFVELVRSRVQDVRPGARLPALGRRRGGRPSRAPSGWSRVGRCRAPRRASAPQPGSAGRRTP